MVPQGFLGIPQEGKGIPILWVSEKREGGKGTQSLVHDPGYVLSQWSMLNNFIE